MGKLQIQFLGLFVKVAALGAIISAIGLLNGDSLEYMLLYSFKMISLSSIGFVLIFMTIVKFLLGSLFDAFEQKLSAKDIYSPEQTVRMAQVCIRFPFNLFRGFLTFGILFAALYLVAEWWVNNSYLHYREWEWAWFFKNFLFKTALVWLLALMLYNGSRNILRPVLSWLAEANPVGLGLTMSFRWRIIGVMTSLTVMMGMQYMYLQIGLAGNERLLPALLGFFLLFLVLSYAFARSAVDDVVKDIDQVRTSLAEFNRLDFPQSTRRLKVESADEVGDLKVQFNSLQEKAEQYYERMSQELALANRVQTSLLPSSPLAAGLVRVEGRSASAADLGGDFFDYAMVDEQTVVVIIGDVSGKGLPAALVTSTVLGLFRAELQHGGTPSDLLDRMNSSISDVLMPGMYVTAGILAIHAESGEYSYASAGHLPPLLLSAKGLTEWETSSLPLGIDRHPPIPELTGVLEPGDRVVFYTDGILEARSPSGELAGFETVRQWVQAGSRTAGNLLQVVADALDTHRSSAIRQDDETIVVLHFGG
ncbi:PP2C family protein-serine/threonine phosphatase [Effusibacillus lacus]|uniref:HAMP domain-containing protein n=1 Tax=Effusibacillus lacus TaxID=1348429 RepID=A0A292YPN9_9BACL|nr:PP2C family protein-serine/threonine phosphatase [Effusibacillus lacus]TCS76815.1 serine phosphatase RsbU (regulator of sigma subunit) [Effusibacillus lacus]GAX91146.1 hypothetical protein EFBL_2812 [Effusibacillus lacus]